MAETGEPSSGGYSVPPVERALSLLRYIGDGHRCRNLSAASKDLKINRTTLIRLLATLCDNQMIEKIDEGAGYRLGPGLISLAAQAVHGRDIVLVCQPILADLTQTLGMSSHLGILDGADVVYLSRETPNTHLVSNVRAGSRLPAHVSSMGRAILAELSEQEIRTRLSGIEFEAISDKAPVTIDAVVQQAIRDKSNGFAWSESNYEFGIGSCAAVILDHHGRPAGALNVSGPDTLFTREAEDGSGRIRTTVMQAARQASVSLGHVADSS